MQTSMAGQKLHKQGELSTAAGGSTPDPLSSRTLLSMHKYYPQKCSLLFYRPEHTPRFLDQFSRFVGLALVTNRRTTQTLFPAVHLGPVFVFFTWAPTLAMELWAFSKVGLKWTGLSFRANRPGVMVNEFPSACRTLLCFVMRRGGVRRDGSAKGERG